MTSIQITDFLSAVQTALYAVLTAKLWRDGLLLRYRFFATYIVLQLVVSLVRSAIRYGTDAYAYFYFASQPVLILGAFLAISEVYTLVLKDRAEIARLGRRLLPWSVVAAVVLSGITLFVRWSSEGSKSPILESYFTTEQFLYCSILLVVLLISGFLLYFPVPLSRNVILHSSLFACYLFIQVSARLLRIYMGSSATELLNVALMTFGVVCLLIWLMRLTPEGDLVMTKAGAPVWTEEQERRLLGHLDSINTTLQNSAKK